MYESGAEPLWLHDRLEFKSSIAPQTMNDYLSDDLIKTPT
jgi:hypothetical protein